ncbi:MAG TPA: hypothetical protein VLM79_39825, partial [Kofleriaceae bacterium]|nr:hypothetical protein [Kofleriaceae bacterium]
MTVISLDEAPPSALIVDAAYGAVKSEDLDATAVVARVRELAARDDAARQVLELYERGQYLR